MAENKIISEVANVLYTEEVRWESSLGGSTYEVVYVTWEPQREI